MGTISTCFHPKPVRPGGHNEKQSFAVDITLAPGRLEVAEYHAHNSLVFAERGIRKSAKRFVITKGGS